VTVPILLRTLTLLLLLLHTCTTTYGLAAIVSQVQSLAWVPGAWVRSHWSQYVHAGKAAFCSLFTMFSAQLSCCLVCSLVQKSVRPREATCLHVCCICPPACLSGGWVCYNG
jgi:hypothetical protein